MIVEILPRAKCTVVSLSDGAKTNQQSTKRIHRQPRPQALHNLKCVGPIALLSREGWFARGLPAAMMTCIALQKNRMEIEKNNLGWRAKQAGDRRRFLLLCWERM